MNKYDFRHDCARVNTRFTECSGFVCIGTHVLSNMPYGLRNRAMSGKPDTTPPELSATETQTDIVNSAGSDFESFVRKGIADIRGLITNFEEALEFQSQRTTTLEKKVEPLPKKVNILEEKMVSFE